MFDSVVNPTGHDQLHQFIASVSSSSFPHHHPLHVGTIQSSVASSFYDDPFNQSGQSLLGSSNNNVIIEGKSLNNNNGLLISCNNTSSSALQRDQRSTCTDDNNHHHQWSNDEVVALLKVRSSFESWFPDYTWEHVSRKLAELGYKRSADQCKEKYKVEENKHFNSTAISYNNKNHYRFNDFNELDEAVYHPGDHLEAVVSRNTKVVLTGVHKQVEDRDVLDHVVEEANNHSQKSEEVIKESSKKPIKNKKRKRSKKDKYFETLKRYCEAVVNKMMAQQEEMHKKLIEDIIRRDEEKIAKEEAWKNQEMARFQKEVETRAQEQAKAEKRQAIIIEFLKKLTTRSHRDNNGDDDQEQITSQAHQTSRANNHFSTSQGHKGDEEEETILIKVLQNPNSLPSTQNSYYKATKTINEDPRTSSSSATEAMIIESTTSNQEKGFGENDKKRWPRDEVLALINIRCKLSSNNSINTNNNDNNVDNISGGKGHLWERISRGMSEMGYKRSAKRCKEKWENINKYFRRTRDSNKKRSMDSRTCPYFHQLSCLYGEGTSHVLVAPITTDDVP